ncbi:MAG: hypothetical protein ACYC7D_10005 [Nitrososphaerales archaeon]
MEKDQFETLRDLTILLLLKNGVSYDSIANVTGISSKTLRNRFPIGKVMRRED